MTELGILFLTHSSRPWSILSTHLNYLTWRFDKPNRLKKLPARDQLKPLGLATNGSLSIYKVRVRNGEEIELDCLGAMVLNGKVQHVLRLDEQNLIVAFDHGLEQWRFPGPIEKMDRIDNDSYEMVQKMEHPHLAGLRSVYAVGPSKIVVASVAADAVQIVDWRSGSLEKSLRMPSDLYGQNYELTPDWSLHDHFIANNFQTTHVNSAYPAGNGEVVVSTLIQGAIGFYDLESESYREFTRGFLGCHGARVNEDGNVYFSDSCTGSLVFLDEHARIKRRFRVDSLWLHDSLHIHENIYAFSLSDKNELHFYDVRSMKLLCKKIFRKCPHPRLQKLYKRLPGWLGNTTQFLAFAPASSSVNP